MAVAMDTPCYENESIVRVNDDQNFEVVTFSDSSLNSFDVGETRLGSASFQFRRSRHWLLT